MVIKGACDSFGFTPVYCRPLWVLVAGDRNEMPRPRLDTGAAYRVRRHAACLSHAGALWKTIARVLSYQGMINAR
jgi:hypothetical protein